MKTIRQIIASFRANRLTPKAQSQTLPKTTAPFQPTSAPMASPGASVNCERVLPETILVSQPTVPDGESAASQIVQPESEIAFWSEQFAYAVENSAGWLVHASIGLKLARENLTYNDWRKVALQIGGTRSKCNAGEQFMRIANHPYLSDPQNYKNMPLNFSVLYQLSFLEAAELEEGVNRNQIGPATSIHQARRLVRAHNLKQSPNITRPPFNLEKELANIRRCVVKVQAKIPRARRGRLADLLEDLALEMRTNCQNNGPAVAPKSKEIE
jgi:hypothetical protein